MNMQQQVYLRFAELCAEISCISSRRLQVAMIDSHSKNDQDDILKLHRLLDSFHAMIEVLNTETDWGYIADQTAISAKVDKLKQYFKDANHEKGSNN